MLKSAVYEQVLTEMVIRGIRVCELAARAGMHPDTLRRKLRGQAPLSLPEAFAVRRALGASQTIDALFSEAGKV